MILSSLTGRNNTFSPKRQNRLRVPSRCLFTWSPGGSTTEVKRPERKVKRPERDADHSPSSSAEVNEWNCKSTPLTCLHGVYRNLTVFTFTFIFTADKAKNETEKLLLDKVR